MGAYSIGMDRGIGASCGLPRPSRVADLHRQSRLQFGDFTLEKTNAPHHIIDLLRSVVYYRIIQVTHDFKQK